jgi:hypothetical protein
MAVVVAVVVAVGLWPEETSDGTSDKRAVLVCVCVKNRQSRVAAYVQECEHVCGLDRREGVGSSDWVRWQM